MRILFNLFSKNFYFFIIFPILITLFSCSSKNEKALEECKNASNYYKCLEDKNINSSKPDIQRTSSYKKEKAQCLNYFKKLKNQKLDNLPSKESIDLGCSNLAEEFALNPNHIAKKVSNIYVTTPNNPIRNYNDLGTLYKFCMVMDQSEGFKESDLTFRQIQNDLKFYCSCSTNSYSKLPRWSKDGKIFVGHETKDDLIGKSCWWQRPSQVTSNQGILYFVKKGNNFSSEYGIQIKSVKQAKIRNKYGRYISFTGLSTNEYEGTSGFTIPGTPGYLDCSWGGSGSSYYNDGYGTGSWSSGGYCYGQEGTDPIDVPGSPAGVQKDYFTYLLDCEDKTFDRKGDISVSGSIYKKGWMETKEDSTAIYAEGVFCPIISSLPKDE